MKKAILGKKIGMTQVFVSDGRLVPVTVVEAGPCTVTMVKTCATDGYEAIQVGFGELSEQRAKKLLNKPELGHFAKAGVAPAAPPARVPHGRQSPATPSATRSSATCSRRATRSTSSEPRRDTAIPASSSAGTSTPARWHTAPSITAASALWAPTPRLRACSRTSICRPVRRRPRHRAEPRGRQGGCGAQPASDQGRDPRSERQPRHGSRRCEGLIGGRNHGKR